MSDPHVSMEQMVHSNPLSSSESQTQNELSRFEVQRPSSGLNRELRVWARDLVVVFWYPLDRTKSFIKRVVGLPGDEVEIRRGRVYINGKSLEERYVPSQYVDTAAYGPVQIPREEYFVMGDHRISSNDSRIFGPVPAAFIYGKAVFAYWPWTQFGSITSVNASE